MFRKVRQNAQYLKYFCGIKRRPIFAFDFADILLSKKLTFSKS